jgi:DNA polymerase III delta subunit
MTIIDLKTQIMKNCLTNLYVFVGEEIGIMNIYLNQMSKTLNMPVTRAESVASIYAECTSKSMFGNTTGFYVIRNDKDITKEEKAYQSLSKDIGKNVIVLLYDKVDSRLKFGKFFKDQTITFEKLAPNVLKSYVKKACPGLSDKNCEHLIELCNGSYDLCMLEIDKILHYQETTYDRDDYKDSVDHCFDVLLKSGVIYQPQESDVFKWTDAVCTRNCKEAFKLERILRDNGTQSVTMLGTLYNSLKSILLIQCCQSSHISVVTGLDNRQIYFNKKYVGNFDTSDLVYAVKLIASVVDGIKTGLYDDVYATRYVLSIIL